ncbi:unnamed protein product, partial [Gulo gulo]
MNLAILWTEAPGPCMGVAGRGILALVWRGACRNPAFPPG